MEQKVKLQIQHILKENPFSVMLGVELIEIEEGCVVGKMPFQKQHQNFYGGMHGGCSFALADTVSGFAALTYGDYVTTVDSSMNYLRAVKGTEYLYCKGTVVRHGRSLTVVSVELTNDEGELVMNGSFTYYTLGKIDFSGEGSENGETTRV